MPISLSATLITQPCGPNLSDLLQALLGLSGRMRLAAEMGHWEAMAEMQTTCTALIERIRLQTELENPLSPELLQEKQQIMLALLQDDARIRSLSTTRAGRLVPKLWPAASTPWLH
jgi:hypothetical protein